MTFEGCLLSDDLALGEFNGASVVERFGGEGKSRHASLVGGARAPGGVSSRTYNLSLDTITG